MSIPVVVTLAIGILIGYAGQRSRFCIVSGFRDLFLMRDYHRFKGFLALIVSASAGFLLFQYIGGDVPNFPIGVRFGSAGYIMVSIIGGIGMGFFSVLAEGCPFRQHIMASEGRQSALFYLLGFYIGIIYFYAVTLNFIKVVFALV